MRNLLNSVLICGACLLAARAGAVPDVSFEVYVFHSGEGGIAEVALYFPGSSLACPSSQSGYGATYLLLVQDSLGQVVAGDRFRQEGKGCPAKDLLDLRRFLLKPGQYRISVEAADLHDSLAIVRQEKIIRIPASTEAWKLSDIQLLSTAHPDTSSTSQLVKSGLYMEPLPFQYYYPALDRLLAYIEVYHADRSTDQPFLQYSLAPLNGDVPPPIVSYKKLARTDVQAQLLQLDISRLISGTYRLEVVLFDGKDHPVDNHSAIVFRYNPAGDSTYLDQAGMTMDDSFVRQLPEDSLNYFLRAHLPVVSSMDADVINQLVRTGSPKARRFFLHRYWTGQSGRMAAAGFAAYMRVARYVDDLFRSGFGYGFETDRGHIFLKYGRPDDIIAVEDEPSAPPYEIWFYNDFPMTRQSDVRFLFYNPTLAKNAFTLLHSTAIGSVRNPRWEVELYKDATLETPGVNDRVMGDNVHRNARRYFEN